MFSGGSCCTAANLVLRQLHGRPQIDLRQHGGKTWVFDLRRRLSGRPGQSLKRRLVVGSFQSRQPDGVQTVKQSATSAYGAPFSLGGVLDPL
jgi:hypothetical protein